LVRDGRDRARAIFRVGRITPRRILLLLIAMLWSAPCWAACDVTTPIPAGIGTYSSGAVKTGVVPYVQNSGGFACTSSAILTLLSGNYLIATATAPTGGFVLTGPAGATVNYVVAADSAGTKPFTSTVSMYYINGTLVDVLGLLSGGVVDAKIYIHPTSSTAVAAGAYTGSFTIRWQWYFCSGIGALGLCVGTIDQGNKVTTVNVTLIVQANPILITISSTTTWDPLDTTTNPNAIPGSKRRATVVVSNPDIAPADIDTVVITVPTPPQTAIALDGDGASGGAAIRLTDGSPSSTLAFTFTSGASTTDDVDFSADGGATWTSYPTAGDATSQNIVNRVRLRPRGSMAPLSSFSISLPYSVR
jgi:hypothetical protein